MTKSRRRVLAGLAENRPVNRQYRMPRPDPQPRARRRLSNP